MATATVAAPPACIVDRKAFAQALAQVGKAVDRRNVIPVLTGVLLEASGSTLRLVGTDLGLAVERTISAEVTEPGRAVLPWRRLSDVVRWLPGQEVSLAHGEAGGVQVVDGPRTYRFNDLGADQFPNPDPVEGNLFVVNTVALRRLIRRTVYTVAKDDTRPYLQGVNMTIRNGKLTAIATNSARIGLAQAAVDAGEDGTGGIVNGRALKILGDMLRQAGDSTVQIVMGESESRFVSGGLSVRSRLMEGQFPDVMRLVPQQFRTTVTVNREALIGTLRRLAGVLHNSTPTIRLTVNDAGVLTFTAQHPEWGEAEECITASQFVGSPVKMGWNPDLLREAALVLDSADIILEFSGERNPARFRPSGDDSTLHIGLPLISY